MTFLMRITLGNEAMQLPSDVAQALETLARKMRAEPNEFEPAEQGNIRDVNGNKVGTWGVVREEDAS